jgi:putative ABC transport system ATP-binding protein
MNLLHKLHAQGTTIVMVTHDTKIAAHTQRTVQLIDGLVDSIIHNGKQPASSEIQHEAL